MVVQRLPMSRSTSLWLLVLACALVDDHFANAQVEEITFGQGNDICLNGSKDQDSYLEVYSYLEVSTGGRGQSLMYECPGDAAYQALECEDLCEFTITLYISYRSHVRIEFAGDSTLSTHVEIKSDLPRIDVYTNFTTPSSRQQVEFEARELADVTITTYTGILRLYSIRLESEPFSGITFGDGNDLCLNGPFDQDYDALTLSQLYPYEMFGPHDFVYYPFKPQRVNLDCPAGASYQAFGVPEFGCADGDDCLYGLHFRVPYRTRVFIELAGDADLTTHVQVIRQDEFEDTIIYSETDTPSTRQVLEFDVEALIGLSINRLSGILYIYSIQLDVEPTSFPAVTSLPTSPAGVTGASGDDGLDLILYISIPAVVLLLALCGCGGWYMRGRKQPTSGKGKAEALELSPADSSGKDENSVKLAVNALNDKDSDSEKVRMNPESLGDGSLSDSGDRSPSEKKAKKKAKKALTLPEKAATDVGRYDEKKAKKKAEKTLTLPEKASTDVGRHDAKPSLSRSKHRRRKSLSKEPSKRDEANVDAGPDSDDEEEVVGDDEASSETEDDQDSPADESESESDGDEDEDEDEDEVADYDDEDEVYSSEDTEDELYLSDDNAMARSAARRGKAPEEKRFSCEDCGKKFTQRSNMMTHRRRDHGNAAKKYACSQCDKSFHKSSNLRAHVLTHDAKAKPFFCTICDRSFAQKVNYVNHVDQVHERPGTCPVRECRERFRSNAEFGRHVVEVHENLDRRATKVFVKAKRSYKCYCQSSFVSLDEKVGHQLQCLSYLKQSKELLALKTAAKGGPPRRSKNKAKANDRSRSTGSATGQSSLPSLSQGSEQLPSLSQGSEQLPPLSQGSELLPSLSQGGVLPSLSQGSEQVPSLSHNTDGVANRVRSRPADNVAAESKVVSDTVTAERTVQVPESRANLDRYAGALFEKGSGASASSQGTPPPEISKDMKELYIRQMSAELLAQPGADPRSADTVSLAKLEALRLLEAIGGNNEQDFLQTVESFRRFQMALAQQSPNPGEGEQARSAQSGHASTASSSRGVSLVERGILPEERKDNELQSGILDNSSDSIKREATTDAESPDRAVYRANTPDAKLAKPAIKQLLRRHVDDPSKSPRQVSSHPSAASATLESSEPMVLESLYPVSNDLHEFSTSGGMISGTVDTKKETENLHVVDGGVPPTIEASASVDTVEGGSQSDLRLLRGDFAPGSNFAFPNTLPGLLSKNYARSISNSLNESYARMVSNPESVNSFTMGNRSNSPSLQSAVAISDHLRPPENMADLLQNEELLLNAGSVSHDVKSPFTIAAPPMFRNRSSVNEEEELGTSRAARDVGGEEKGREALVARDATTATATTSEREHSASRPPPPRLAHFAKSNSLSAGSRWEDQAFVGMSPQDFATTSLRDDFVARSSPLGAAAMSHSGDEADEDVVSL